MNVPNLRPLGFGEILDGAFTLYRRNFVTFAVTALVPTALMLALMVFVGFGVFASLSSGDATQIISAFLGIGLIVGLAVGLLFMAMYGALTRQASQSYTGQHTSVGDGFSAGARAVLPMLGATLLAVILFIIAVFAVGIVIGIVTALVAMMGIGILTVLVTILAFCAMAAVYLGGIALLFAVLPAIVVEGKGPIDAISRSIDLARGALGRVVGLMLVTLVITYLPILAVMLLTGSFAQITNPGTVPSTGQFVTQQVLSMGVGVLTTPFMMAVVVLLYYDRRVRTEALDVQMLTDRLAVAGA
jgi:hypothetical protein